MKLSSADVAVVAVSVVSVVSFGIYTSLTKTSKNSVASDEYFLARRTMPWFIVAASLFAANVGSEQFIGMAGTAAESGIAVGIYELSAPYLLIMLGWIFAPLYVKMNIRTTPEYLEMRFNKYLRLVFVMVLMLMHILGTISATLYAGTVVMEVVTGLTIWQSAPLIVLLTALYTITGGLKAVMMTDALQTVILLTGGVVGSATALNLVGGISGLFRRLEAADLRQFPHLVRSLDDRDFPCLGTWIALVIGGLRCWCLDQEMAQRVLSARDLNHARFGTAGAGLLKLLPLFITILPGMVARALYQQCIADPTGDTFPEWCATQLSDTHHTNKAYPLLVLHQFPEGVKGLMIASFLAAMMSSLASLFNSVSSMFTFDIYARFMTRKVALSPREIVRVGRCAVGGLVILTFLWIPVIDSSNRGLFVMASVIMTHLGPPITAVFFCGIFFRSINEQGALIGLITGSVIGIVRLIFFLIFQDMCDDQVDDDNRQTLTSTNWLVCLNFHYFCTVLFALTFVMITTMSAFYPPPSATQLDGNTVTFSLLSQSYFASNVPFRYIELAEDPKRDDDEEENIEQEPDIRSEGEQASPPSPLFKHLNRLGVIFLPIIVLGLTTWIIYYFS